LSVHQFSPHPDVLFNRAILNLRHFQASRFAHNLLDCLHSVEVDLLAISSPSMYISHSHAELICAYDGVNGVTFRVIAQSLPR
jgi:hypothetical protein